MPGRVRWIAIGAGLVYGLLFRLMFSSKLSSSPFNVMSIAFLFGMPFGLGFLQVYLSELSGRRSWPERLFVPWIPALLCLGVALALAWEGLICIFLWIPLVLIMSLLGGLVAGIVRDVLSWRSRHFMLTWCFALPILITPVEHYSEPPRQIRTVATELPIQATPTAIWEQIKSVPAIQPAELNETWTQRIGFPRPIAATLSYEGVGGIRKASFEKGVVFWETVTCWKPSQKLAFTIRADTAAIPPTTLDEHVTVGGPYFDVLEGEYRIEQIGPNQAILHLSSQHRLSTKFNLYAGLWTDAIMRDVQENILQVIKKRCEAHKTA